MSTDLTDIPGVGMRVTVIPFRNLDPACRARVDERVTAPEHAFDNGPRQIWGEPAYWPNLYVALLAEPGLPDPGIPIGILYAAGPKDNVDAGWWIDSQWRGKGYGSAAIDIFANLLRSQGATGVGNIVVDTFRGEHHQASSRLVARFKAHFK